MASQQTYPGTMPTRQPPPKRRKGGAAKALAVLVVLLLLFFILFYTPIGRHFIADLTGNSYAESATFVLNREITIDIRQGDISWACDIPVPEDLDNGNIQDIASVAPVPQIAPTEKYNDDWIVWTGTDSDIVMLTVSYTATAFSIRRK